MAEGRVLPPEFRVAVAERLLNGESASALSGELQIKRSVLYRWRDRYRKEGAEGLNRPRGRPPGDGVPAGKGKKASTGRWARRQQDRRTGTAAGAVGAGERFFRKAFKRVKEARSNNNAPGEVPCTEK
jgi:transposase-like protein